MRISRLLGFVMMVFVLCVAACTGPVAPSSYGSTTAVRDAASEPSALVCDLDGDGFVTLADLQLLRTRNNQLASGPGDPYDPNGDGRINIADVRYCQLRLTTP